MAHLISGRHRDGSGPWYVARVCDHTLTPIMWVRDSRMAFRFACPVQAAHAEVQWTNSPRTDIMALRVEHRP